MTEEADALDDEDEDEDNEEGEEAELDSNAANAAAFSAAASAFDGRASEAAAFANTCFCEPNEVGSFAAANASEASRVDEASPAKGAFDDEEDDA